MSNKERHRDLAEILRQLAKQGKEKGLWTSDVDCARIVGIKKGTFGPHLNGYGPRESIERSIDMVRTRIESPDAQPSGSAPHSLLAQAKQLFEQGERNKTWSGISDCAKKIRVSRDQLSRCLHDSRSSLSRKLEKLLRKIVAAMRQRLKSSESSASAEQNLFNLFQEGKRQQLWKGQDACADTINVDRGTFSFLLKADPGTLTPRRRQFHEKVLRKLQARVRMVEPLQTRTTEVAEQPQAESSPPAPAAGIDGMIRTLVADALGSTFKNPQILDLLASALKARLPAQDSATNAPAGVIGSPWYDRIVAGVAECTDQNLNGIRYVLTERNFRKYRGIKTKEEIEDTKLLVEELRRRINLIAQLENQSAREQCYLALRKELRELFLAYLSLQHEQPWAAAPEIDQLRLTFQSFDNN